MARQSSYVMKSYQTLAEWGRVAVQRRLAMLTVHIDETSLRVERKKR